MYTWYWALLEETFRILHLFEFLKINISTNMTLLDVELCCFKNFAFIWILKINILTEMTLHAEGNSEFCI